MMDIEGKIRIRKTKRLRREDRERCVRRKRSKKKRRARENGITRNILVSVQRGIRP